MLQLLYPLERTQIRTEQGAGWAVQPVWMFWRKENGSIFTVCLSTTPVTECGYVGSQCGICGKENITSDPHPARTV